MGTSLPRTIQVVGGQTLETVKALPARLEKFADRALDALQRNLLDVLLPLALSPIGGGNLILNQAFVPFAPTVIQHRLGRAFVGWFVCSPFMASGSHLPPIFWQVAQDSSLDAVQATVQSSATCTGHVYVF